MVVLHDVFSHQSLGATVRAEIRGPGDLRGRPGDEPIIPQRRASISDILHRLVGGRGIGPRISQNGRCLVLAPKTHARSYRCAARLVWGSLLAMDPSRRSFDPPRLSAHRLPIFFDDP